MSNVRKSNYEKIVKIFNGSGNKTAMKYVQQTFGEKYPRDVIIRIKNLQDIVLIL